MKLNVLYEKAKALGVEEEEHTEVLEFINIHEAENRQIAVCGYCGNRGTDKCPWPNQSKIAYPSCLDFKKKQ